MLKSIFRALQAATLLQGFTRSPTHVATPPPKGSVGRCRNGRAAGGQRSDGWSRTPRTHLDRAHATHSLTHARSQATHAGTHAHATPHARALTHKLARLGRSCAFLTHWLGPSSDPLTKGVITIDVGRHLLGRALLYQGLHSTKAASASLTLRSPLWHVWLPSTQEAPQGNILNGQ